MPKFVSGDKLKLDTKVYKANRQIKIHPASFANFPEALDKGTPGEVIDFDGREIFVKFAGPKGPLNVTFPVAAAWMLAKG